MSKDDFPPNVPVKLIKMFTECESKYRVLARRLDLNPAHVYNLLVHGKEPADREIRKKLFLPSKARQPLPMWLVAATQNLARLEEQAPSGSACYNRKGKRVR